MTGLGSNNGTGFDASPGTEMQTSAKSVAPSAILSSLSRKPDENYGAELTRIARDAPPGDKRLIGCDSAFITRSLLIYWAAGFILSAAAVRMFLYLSVFMWLFIVYQVLSLYKCWLYYGYNKAFYFVLNAAAFTGVWFAGYPLRLLLNSLVERYAG